MANECENCRKTDRKSNDNFFTKLSIYFKEYCSVTSIHGFQYFGENRTILEKLLWIVFFTISLTGCAYGIYSIYSKWSSSPVIVSFANKGMPIHEIPFPAVTVCSESKIKGGLLNITQIYHKAASGESLNKTEERYLNYLVTMCQIEYEFENLTRLENDDILQAMEEISPQLEIIDCKLWGIDIECSRIFSPIITDEGPCYTFNILGRDEMFSKNVIRRGNYHEMGANSTWDPEHGYSESASIDTYPQRALLSGARYSLKFDIKIMKKDVEIPCREAEEGFKVLVHSPLRMPRMTQQFIIIPYDHRVAGTLRPSMISTSDTVRKYHPEMRRCYFPSEQQLGYFKPYSSKNCGFECLTNFTLEKCGCIDFYMPRFNGTRICGASDFKCMKKSEYIFQLFMLTKKVSTLSQKDREEIGEFSEEIERLMSKCNCMPMCTDIEYHVGISQTPWSWAKDYESLNESLDFHLTRFSLYFISNNFIGSERNELYGPVDFLANFGGILGLFTGFSVLSFMEIVYFLTARIFCNCRLYRNWSGPV